MLQRLFIIMLFLATPQLSWAMVDINTASEVELQSLSGIGPTRAKAIIADRKKNGLFKKVDDLARVKGIGSKTVNALRADLSVGGGMARPATSESVTATSAAKSAASSKPPTK